MTARSIRRALERKQKKLARKAEPQNFLAMPTSAAPAMESGVCFDSVDDREPAARLAANRAASASCNAVKTGLTGRTVLLSTENAAEYECHLAAFQDEYQPIGLLECELVQSIADTFWRLARIPCLETAIFAKGRIEFANLFDEQELAGRPHLIDAHTFLVYEKQIRNLQLQEARLVRRREKETAELRKLQAERQQKEARQPSGACSTPSGNRQAPARALPGDYLEIREAPPANGFEFSTAELQGHPLRARTASASPQLDSSHAAGQTITHQAA